MNSPDLPNVLVLEDDEDLQAWLQTMFGSSYAMSFTSTVTACRAELLARDFDLLVVDLMLPDGKGTALLRELKESPDFEGKREIPTLVMTATREEADFEEAWELGSVAYVLKPITYDTMLEAFERVF